MKKQNQIRRSTLLYGGVFFATGLIAFVLRLREEGTALTDALVWLVLGSVLFRYTIIEGKLSEAKAELKALKDKAS